MLFSFSSVTQRTLYWARLGFHSVWIWLLYTFFIFKPSTHQNIRLQYTYKSAFQRSSKYKDSHLVCIAVHVSVAEETWQVDSWLSQLNTGRWTEMVQSISISKLKGSAEEYIAKASRLSVCLHLSHCYLLNIVGVFMQDIFLLTFLSRPVTGHFKVFVLNYVHFWNDHNGKIWSWLLLSRQLPMLTNTRQHQSGLYLCVVYNKHWHWMIGQSSLGEQHIPVMCFQYLVHDCD